MLIISDIVELKETLSVSRRKFRHLSLVPTMGNLHEGHLKLVNQASEISDFVCASIFINPLQFGPKEDYSAYPRTLDEDLNKLDNTNCSLVFLPESEDLLFNIKEFKADPYLSSVLCGKTRKNHFDGVVTIVNKLFDLFKPKSAYFGEKDYQQLIIIKDFVRRHDLNIKIEGIPTEREESGLAKSSRNMYLSHVEKEKASLIYRSLCKVRQSILNLSSIDKALEEAIVLLEENNFKVDYLEARSRESLKSSKDLKDIILFCAATINNVRLIDNLKV
tara:strand:- start:7561 stop:8388 length:828 start_codon:yes stop_codon:yes gene_type:complete